MTKKSKPGSKAKARGEPPPGLEPSPAWVKMKAGGTPKLGKGYAAQRVHRTQAGPGMPGRHWGHDVVPGKCTCGEEIFADNGVEGVSYDNDGKLIVHRRPPNPEGVRMNPWVFGHAYWCSMFMAKCPDCGHMSGTHDMNCQFWKLHPNLSPF